MSQINSNRVGCKDVFNAFLVSDASYDGYLEIPRLIPGIYRPKKLIPFSKAISSEDYDCWVHFYEDDVAFERIWRNPRKYIPILLRFNGVISPDFSLYRDMPLIMQFWNIYRNRAIGTALQREEQNVIPNIRFSDSRTFEECCFGIEKHSTIAIGIHGCIKILEDRKHFVEGLDYVVNHLEPKIIIVYGAAPSDIFDKYRKHGIEILQFDSDFSRSRKEKNNGNR